MTRTYVVTGAGSGIGAATTSHLRARGDTVIACDLRDGDVVGDLSTIEGRAALIDGVARLSGGTIDGVVANAGGGPPETMLALNFFGAVATLIVGILYFNEPVTFWRMFFLSVIIASCAGLKLVE